MTLAFLVSTVWLLSMLAAVAHAARPTTAWTDLAWLALPFALVLLATAWVAADPGWIGLLVALGAAWRVLHEGSPKVDRLLGGLCAGLAAALHMKSGVSPLVATAVTAAFLAAAVWLAQGARAGTGRLRELALLAVAWLAPVVGLGPALAEGWRAATVLNRSAATAPVHIVPTWALAFVALALLAGAIRGFLKQR